jgi:hypothetical protein
MRPSTSPQAKPGRGLRFPLVPRSRGKLRRARSVSRGAELHHHVAFGKDSTHPTWVKIVCWAARKNSRVPSSPWYAQ